jgi:hypothetical protein
VVVPGLVEGQESCAEEIPMKRRGFLGLLFAAPAAPFALKEILSAPATVSLASSPKATVSLASSTKATALGLQGYNTQLIELAEHWDAFIAERCAKSTNIWRDRIPRGYLSSHA